jgi:hypothetical protein
MINVFTNNEFGGSSSGHCCVFCARRSFVRPGTEITQQGGGRRASSSNNNLVLTIPLPSNKIQGVCHGTASGCSMSSRVLCTVACPPPSLLLPSLLPPLPSPSLLTTISLQLPLLLSLLLPLPLLPPLLVCHPCCGSNSQCYCHCHCPLCCYCHSPCCPCHGPLCLLPP